MRGESDRGERTYTENMTIETHTQCEKRRHKTKAQI
jgi:hypothetical protein